MAGARTVGTHAGKFFRKGLYFEAVDTDHGMAVVHEEVRQREAGRAHADHQYAVTAVRARQRPTQVERVPAREQGIYFEAPRKFEHVLESARLGLRNVDRLLLLVNAGFHAVIADAVAGGRGQRIVDGDNGECGNGVAGRLKGMEFGNFFFQRATGECHAEGTFPEDGFAVSAGLLFQAGRAGVFGLVVAPDAVVGLGEGALEIGALVGQDEALPATDVLRLDGEGGDAIRLVLLCMRQQILRIELGGHLEQHAGVVARAASLGVQGPGGVAQRKIDWLDVRRLVLQPGFNMRGVGEFAEGAAETDCQFRFQRGTIEGRGHVGFVLGHRLALHELALDVVERREFLVAAGQGLHFAGNTE